MHGIDCFLGHKFPLIVLLSISSLERGNLNMWTNFFLLAHKDSFQAQRPSMVAPMGSLELYRDSPRKSQGFLPPIFPIQKPDPHCRAVRGSNQGPGLAGCGIRPRIKTSESAHFMLKEDL